MAQPENVCVPLPLVAEPSGGRARRGLDPEFSHVIGPVEPPLRDCTIGQAMAATVAAHGDEEALVVRHHGIRWTWAELDRKVEGFAAGLIALGLLAGDRVGIWSPNRAEWVVTQLATARAGLILVTINPSYRAVELEHALRTSGCRVLVIASRFKTSDYTRMVADLLPELAAIGHGSSSTTLPLLERVIQLDASTMAGALPYDDVVELGLRTDPAVLKERSAQTLADDPINIQFTSGTTGSPKGATLTHRNILNNAIAVGAHMGFTSSDRLCLPVPLYHCFGMVMGVLNCVAHGATMVMPSEAFDPRDVLAAVAAERCTALFGVPTMFVAALAQPDIETFDLSSLRTGIMAGAPCPVDVMRRVIDVMNIREITICYGMTETSPVSFQTPAHADLVTRTETVGYVHPNVEAKIIDTAGGTTPTGTPGELLVRGYNVMRGYWGDAEKSAEAIDADGWMHTGDLATIDQEGRARIVGRIKDMIIRGGENIYPAEVESFLHTHPDIVEVAVFGVRHAHFGEEVCAWIRCVRPLTAEKVRAFCRERIAHYKIPVHVRFVDTFPMTVTGKIQKFEMRAEMTARLGRSASDEVRRPTPTLTIADSRLPLRDEGGL